MADHPWPRGRKTLRAGFGLLDEARRLGRAAAAARPMRGLVFAEGLGRVGRTLVRKPADEGKTSRDTSQLKGYSQASSFGPNHTAALLGAAE
jgi:hypothetical protein